MVSLVDAPLSLKQPSSVPPSAIPKTSIPPEAATNTPASAKPKPAPKPEAKTPVSKPEPAPKAEVKQSAPPKPEAGPKTEVKQSASAKKPKVAEPATEPKTEPDQAQRGPLLVTPLGDRSVAGTSEQACSGTTAGRSSASASRLGSGCRVA